jgi:hypothetical protein
MAKKALVAGVNNYTNWNSGVTVGNLVLSAPNLNFCVNDANAFADVLRNGFSFDDVTVLLDQQATSQAILNGLQSLLNAGSAGDTVCFYFSGHGGRLPDSSSTSRYYETLIPYDATMITSNQVAQIAQALLPSAINFTLVLDSCHSGGMYLSPEDRGFVWTQDAANAFQAACQAIVPWICVLDPSVCDGNVSNLTLQSSGVCTMTVDTSKDSLDSAQATLLSACDYGELSKESACNFQISHPDLLAQLVQKVAAYAGAGQTPQLRGRPVRMNESFLAGWTYSI